MIWRHWMFFFSDYINNLVYVEIICDLEHLREIWTMTELTLHDCQRHVL